MLDKSPEFYKCGYSFKWRQLFILRRSKATWSSDKCLLESIVDQGNIISGLHFES